MILVVSVESQVSLEAFIDKEEKPFKKMPRNTNNWL